MLQALTKRQLAQLVMKGSSTVTEDGKPVIIDPWEWQDKGQHPIVENPKGELRFTGEVASAVERINQARRKTHETGVS